MIYLVYAIHLMVSIFLILVVLLQQGKGADLSVFGGGSTQTAFGATGATSLLHKLTVTSFVLFIVTTMTIAIVEGTADRSSVMQSIEETADSAADDDATPDDGAEPPDGEATDSAPAGDDGAAQDNPSEAGVESEESPTDEP